ncbi:hypothetical protein ACISUF_29825, partial [Streptomyces sp. NPDC003090]
TVSPGESSFSAYVENSPPTLTGALMACVPVAAGAALPLVRSAADGATLALLVPALLVVTPLLVAVQAWTWWAFRRRVTGPSYL